MYKKRRERERKREMSFLSSRSSATDSKPYKDENLITAERVDCLGCVKL
jgi:hypothetical protein